MPTYITLIDYTQEGVANIQDSPDRLAAAKELCESLGGEILEFYLTFGRHDAVAITEFPNDEAAAQALLAIGREGAVSTETLRAFPEGEYQDVIDGIPG